MTYKEAKIRTRSYLYSSIALFALGCFGLVAVFTKATYYAAKDHCILHSRLCAQLQYVTATLFNEIPPFSWVWSLLPDIQRVPFMLFWLNYIGIPSIFLITYAMVLLVKRARLCGLLHKAEEEAHLANFKEGLRGRPDTPGHAGGISNLQAGRDIIINQTTKDWDKKPTQNPVAAWVVGIVGTVLASVLGAAALHFLGLKS